MLLIVCISKVIIIGIIALYERKKEPVSARQRFAANLPQARLGRGISQKGLLVGLHRTYELNIARCMLFERGIKLRLQVTPLFLGFPIVFYGRIKGIAEGNFHYPNKVGNSEK